MFASETAWVRMQVQAGLPELIASTPWVENRGSGAGGGGGLT